MLINKYIYPYQFNTIFAWFNIFLFTLVEKKIVFMSYIFELIMYAFPFAIILNLSIGPLFFLTIETALSKGLRCALSLILGIAFSDIFYIFVCYFSSKDILQKLESNWTIFLIGGIVIFIYGIRLLTKKKTEIKK